MTKEERETRKLDRNKESRGMEKKEMKKKQEGGEQGKKRDCSVISEVLKIIE